MHILDGLLLLLLRLLLMLPASPEISKSPEGPEARKPLIYIEIYIELYIYIYISICIFVA